MIEDCRNLDSGIRWYVFGSMLSGLAAPSDIDILCVVPDEYPLANVKKVCVKYLTKAPIDLRLLHKSDESDLNFIERIKIQEI